MIKNLIFPLVFFGKYGKITTNKKHNQSTHFAMKTTSMTMSAALIWGEEATAPKAVPTRNDRMERSTRLMERLLTFSVVTTLAAAAYFVVQNILV
jgi:hypothetical protein